MTGRTARRADDGVLQSRPFSLKLNASPGATTIWSWRSTSMVLRASRRRGGHLDVRPSTGWGPHEGCAMEDDQGGRGHLQRANADLSGIDRGVVDRAALQQLVADQGGSSCSRYNSPGIPRCRGAQLATGSTRRPSRRSRAGDGTSRAARPWPWRLPSASAVLIGGDAGFAEPGDGTQRIGPRREDPGGRAEGVEQDPGEFPRLRRRSGIRPGGSCRSSRSSTAARPARRKARAQFVVSRYRRGAALPARGTASRRAGRGRAYRRGSSPGPPEVWPRAHRSCADRRRRPGPQPRRLRSNSSSAPRWALKSGSSDVAASTELPETADAGDRRVGHRFQDQQPAQECGEHRREVLAPARVHGVHGRGTLVPETVREAGRGWRRRRSNGAWHGSM